MRSPPAGNGIPYRTAGSTLCHLSYHVYRTYAACGVSMMHLRYRLGVVH